MFNRRASKNSAFQPGAWNASKVAQTMGKSIQKGWNNMGTPASQVGKMTKGVLSKQKELLGNAIKKYRKPLK